jgi:hypothetical protein
LINLFFSKEQALGFFFEPVARELVSLASAEKWSSMTVNP